MKVFRRLSALIMALVLLLSMSLTVLAADIASEEQFYEAYGNGETDYNMTAENISVGFKAKENTSYTFSGQALGGMSVTGSGTVTVNSDVNGGVNAGESAKVTVDGDVNGYVGAVGDAEVTVGGSVDGGVSALGDMDNKDSAQVTVGGNVNGYVNAHGDAEVTVGGNVNGGVNAFGDAEVTVEGNVTGNDAPAALQSRAGNGVTAFDNAKVTIGGNVKGGDVIADPDTESSDYESQGGSGIRMSNSANVRVNGNVSGGSTNGNAGIGGNGVYIMTQSEKAGSLTVGGAVTGGSAEIGIDGVGLFVYAAENIPLPEMTVGSYDSIAGVIVTEDDESRDMTEEELEALKAEIKIAPKGESKQVADNFWNNVLGKIRKAQPGDEITVNVYSRMSIPASVIEAVRQYDVKLIIQWAGGDDLVITKDFTAEVKGTILLKDLAEMLKK